MSAGAPEDPALATGPEPAMSAGADDDEPHVRVDANGVDRCAAVVDHINEIIDREVDLRDLDAVRAHILACPPCLAEHDVQVALRALVRRSCSSDRAPEALRTRIVTTITQVRIVSE